MNGYVGCNRKPDFNGSGWEWDHENVRLQKNCSIGDVFDAVSVSAVNTFIECAFNGDSAAYATFTDGNYQALKDGAKFGEYMGINIDGVYGFASADFHLVFSLQEAVDILCEDAVDSKDHSERALEIAQTFERYAAALRKAAA